MSGDEWLLELRGIEKAYEKRGSEGGLSILRGLDLQVRRGEALAILGPSGSGKTTLLNLLGALDRPDSGEVRFDGRDLTRASDAELARLRSRELGFVFQSHHLLPHLSLWENVLLPTLADVEPQVRAAAPERAARLLRRVGLAGREGHRPGELSGGERQRAAVVRALVNGPKLLLADEPTGALDRKLARELGSLLHELNREEGVTLIVVTHSMELASEAGRRLEMTEGRLVEVRVS